jgi:hypothetical protein
VKLRIKEQIFKKFSKILLFQPVKSKLARPLLQKMVKKIYHN